MKAIHHIDGAESNDIDNLLMVNLRENGSPMDPVERYERYVPGSEFAIGDAIQTWHCIDGKRLGRNPRKDTIWAGVAVEIRELKPMNQLVVYVREDDTRYLIDASDLKKAALGRIYQ